eukprot:2462841-Amphidinium_carterae.1
MSKEDIILRAFRGYFLYSREWGRELNSQTAVNKSYERIPDSQLCIPIRHGSRAATIGHGISQH